MAPGLDMVSFIACAVLIALYAWERFNTPASNRYSTLRGLYWSSCAGYVCSALLLFAALSFLLEAPAWRKLLSLDGQSSLPAPLIATLAMTTLLQSVPYLKQVDRWILGAFQELGAIPVEVRRRAAAMTPSSFAVTAADVTALRDRYESGYGDSFPNHLREKGTSGFEKSQHRFTRVALLYDRTLQLATEPRYQRFFAENESEFDALRERMQAFMRRAVKSLDSIARTGGCPQPGKVNSVLGDEVFQDLMAEWHERFATDCREHFILLARFLAGAVLRAEPSKAAVVARLREIGFPDTREPEKSGFPLNSLTVLGLAIFVYLVVVTIWFSARTGTSTAVGIGVAGKLTIARLASIAMAVWLLQGFAVFRRRPGEAPRYFAYLVNGVLCGLLAAAIWVLFRFDAGMQFSIEEVRVGILSGMLCAAVAFFCDVRDGEAPAPIWVRPAEAIGCGAVMALGTALIYFLGWAPAMPNLSEEMRLTTWIALPSLMAMMIGGYVPHIYRGARRASALRQASALRHATAPPMAPPTADASGPEPALKAVAPGVAAIAEPMEKAA